MEKVAPRDRIPSNVRKLGFTIAAFVIALVLVLYVTDFREISQNIFLVAGAAAAIAAVAFTALKNT